MPSIHSNCLFFFFFPLVLGFSSDSDSKESDHNVGDLDSIPGSGRFPGEGNGNPFQYSGLENSMDCRVHGVTKSWTGLRDFFITSSNHGRSLVMEPSSYPPRGN